MCTLSLWKNDYQSSFFYPQVNDVLVELPEFPPGAKGVLWENWPLDKVAAYACRRSESGDAICNLYYSAALR